MTQPRPSLLGRLDQTGLPLLVARLAVGGMFVWLAYDKIARPVNFLKLMRQYQLLNEEQLYWAMNLVAVVLPWIELTCGIALILGLAVRGAGIISAAMLAVFTPMILLRGLELFHEGTLSFCQVNFDCGCGAGVVFLCNKLAENVGLLLLSLLIIASRSRRFCLSSALARSNTDNPIASVPQASTMGD